METKQKAIAFAKWIGDDFYYESDSDLWEGIHGQWYEVNGIECFRFSTEELYHLFETNAKPVKDDNDY